MKPINDHPEFRIALTPLHAQQIKRARRRAARLYLWAIVGLIIWWRFLTVTAHGQSTCTMNANGSVTLRPAWVCSEVKCQTSTSINGPWDTVIYVSGQRACAQLAFTVKKTGEPQRYWRIVILK